MITSYWVHSRYIEIVLATYLSTYPELANKAHVGLPEKTVTGDRKYFESLTNLWRLKAASLLSILKFSFPCNPHLTYNTTKMNHL